MKYRLVPNFLLSLVGRTSVNLNQEIETHTFDLKQPESKHLKTQKDISFIYNKIEFFEIELEPIKSLKNKEIFEVKDPVIDEEEEFFDAESDWDLEEDMFHDVASEAIIQEEPDELIEIAPKQIFENKEAKETTGKINHLVKNCIDIIASPISWGKHYASKATIKDAQAYLGNKIYSGAAFISQKYLTSYQAGFKKDELIEDAWYSVSNSLNDSQFLSFFEFALGIISQEIKTKGAEIYQGVVADLLPDQSLISDLIEVNAAKMFANLADSAAKAGNNLPGIENQPVWFRVVMLLHSVIGNQINKEKLMQLEAIHDAGSMDEYHAEVKQLFTEAADELITLLLPNKINDLELPAILKMGPVPGMVYGFLKSYLGDLLQQFYIENKALVLETVSLTEMAVNEFQTILDLDTQRTLVQEAAGGSQLFTDLAAAFAQDKISGLKTLELDKLISEETLASSPELKAFAVSQLEGVIRSDDLSFVKNRLFFQQVLEGVFLKIASIVLKANPAIVDEETQAILKPSEVVLIEKLAGLFGNVYTALDSIESDEDFKILINASLSELLAILGLGDYSTDKEGKKIWNAPEQLNWLPPVLKNVIFDNIVSIFINQLTSVKKQKSHAILLASSNEGIQQIKADLKRLDKVENQERSNIEILLSDLIQLVIPSVANVSVVKTAISSLSETSPEIAGVLMGYVQSPEFSTITQQVKSAVIGEDFDKDKQITDILENLLLEPVNNGLHSLVNLGKSNKSRSTQDLMTVVIKELANHFQTVKNAQVEALDKRGTKKFNYDEFLKAAGNRLNPALSGSDIEKSRKEQIYSPLSLEIVKALFPNGQEDLTFIEPELRKVVWKTLETDLVPIVIPLVVESLVSPNTLLTIALNSLEDARDTLNQKIVLDNNNQETVVNELLGGVGSELLLNVIQMVELPKFIKDALLLPDGSLSPSMQKSLAKSLSKQLNEDFIVESLKTAFESAATRNAQGESKLAFDPRPADVKEAEEIKENEQIKAEIKKVSKQVVIAAIFNFIRTKWTVLQKKLDLIISRLFGSRGVHFKQKVGDLMRWIFLDIVGKTLVKILWPLIHFVENMLYRKIHLDANVDAILNPLIDIQEGQPGAFAHSAATENMVLNILEAVAKEMQRQAADSPVEV